MDAEHDDPDHEGAFRILLVEDNPGDARYIRELFHGAEELSERTTMRTRALAERVGSAPTSEPTILHETRLATGLERFEDEHVDVVLLDLNLPDSDGLETIEALRRHAEAVPVVVLTGVRDRETGMEALRRGAEEYLVKDEINADLLIRSVFHAIERKVRERQLERQRSQLATLNSINELVQQIYHLAIESSTREEIEQLVCAQLADSGSYRFAWIGEIDEDHETVRPRAEAYTVEYLDDLTIRVDESEEGLGPTGKAVRTGEVQAARNIPENPEYEPWRERAREHGFNASVAIPIEYETTLYGVLNVYSERPDAFGDDERAVIGQLGEVIGHAINAIERKQALMSEDVVELRVRIENVLAADVRMPADGTITFDRTIPVSDTVFLEYGTVTASAVDTLDEFVEQLPHFESMKILDDDGEEAQFELRLTESPAFATIASYGGRVESAIIEDGDYRLVVHLPPSADVSRIVDVIREDYPGATVIAQRNTTRPAGGVAHMGTASIDELTEKQLATLEAAYFSGFFEWPRSSSGEDIAESMGVSPSTFHQHIRTAERKLLRGLFNSDQSGR